LSCSTSIEHNRPATYLIHRKGDETMSMQATEYETEYGEAEYGEAEYGQGEYGESEYGEAEYGEAEAPALGEMSEYELAQELLEVRDEQELEQFLGDIINAAGRALSSPTVRSIVRHVAPVAGGLLGSVVPGVGTAIGSAAGSALGNLLGNEELETMSEQEAQQEAARRVVRLATTAGRTASRAPRNVPPQAVARTAVQQAARTAAPGLLRGTPQPPRRPGAGMPPPGRPGPQPGFRARRDRRRVEQRGGRPGPARYPGGQPGAAPAAGGRPRPADLGWPGPVRYGPARTDGWWDGGAADGAAGYDAPALTTGPRPDGALSGTVVPGGDGWAQGAWTDYGQPGAPRRPSMAGRWYRRGNRIIIVGA
jgi:Glycine zipper